MDFKYRSEIDGLRAIAVIPVVFFHAGFNFFSGGYVGVDVFLVISGYLITTIILKGLENKTFSIINFYERRARRILPALIFIIFITSILSFIFLTRSELSSYFRSVIATLLFYSNFYFWKTSPYFKAESDLEPLLHTWSLSIEEQFYLLFPLLLIFFFKYFKKNIFLLFSFGFILSLLVCQFLALKTSGNFNFYFTFSRAWELALGAITAYYLFYNKLVLSNNLKNTFSLIGLLLILFPVFLFDRQTLYPSYFTLIPTIGTVLIIVFADEKTLVKKILSAKVLVGVGLISYSFYLWHQPLLAFGRISFENFSNINKLLAILIALTLSYFSYNYIEKIFRNRNKIDVKFLSKTLITSVFLLIIFAQLNQKFFSTNNSSEVLLAKLLSKNEAVYSIKMDERKFIKNRILYETLDPKILIIGSSRVMQLSNENFNQQVLNLGVSGASVEDHIAITAMALEKFNPDKILLGADPWLFNRDSGQSRWKSISNEYEIALKNIEETSNKYKILKKDTKNEIYNFYEKFVDNIYNNFNKRKLDLDIKSDETKNNTKQIILRDGKIIYGKEKREEKIKDKIIDYSMSSYEFSEDYYNNYNKFIKYLIKVQKKDVVLFLTPYHLTSYNLTVQAKPFYLDVEKRFRELSKEMGVQIVGSYNPSLTDCEEIEFYDNQHPKEDCMKKITSNIN